ncbi:hypothetical protein FRB95_004197 [Tulasnella sp. JGI-2019a]|nr:hypothetical protein FRB95_004197 [Tulasnella sp. JGI-2019a]
MDVNQYIDQALACLMDGAMRCSKSNGSNERQRMFRKLDFLQLSYKALTHHIQRHIAETARTLNSLAPIHCLPNELLIKIISLVPTIGISHPRHLKALGLVSKEWSRVIFETPSLWAQISSNYSDGENRAAILRSKDCPLRVDYHHLRRPAAFIDLASRETYRWRSAEFHLHSYDLLRDLAPLSVPMLEELTIDCGRMEYSRAKNGFDIDIFSGRADRLRHVDLRYFPIPLNSHLLSRLVTLKMSGSYIWSGASTSEITDMLRRCPELRTFELESDEGEIPVSMPSDAEAVHLPVLTSFTLQLENAQAAFSRILSSVRLPACTQFDLWCCNSTSNVFSDATCHITDGLSSTIQRLSDISLRLSSSKLELLGSHDQSNSTVSINVEHNLPWEDLAQLIRHTSATTIWPPIIATILCHEPLPYLPVAGLLCRMPSIVELKLVGNSDPYITLLANPTPSNGANEWVLPNLRKLSLDSCPENSLQLFRDLSRARNRGGNMDEGDRVRLGLPAKLRTNVYPDWIPRDREPFYAALRELMGEDWEGDITDC